MATKFLLSLIPPTFSNKFLRTITDELQIKLSLINRSISTGFFNLRVLAFFLRNIFENHIQFLNHDKLNLLAH